MLDRKFLRTEANQHMEAVKDRPLDPDKPTVFIIGDSHGKGFGNMLSFLGDFNLRHEWVQHWCQPVLGERPADSIYKNKPVTPKQMRECMAQVRAALDSELAADADVIVFHAMWLPWTLERLDQTLAYAREKSDAQLVCVGDGDSFERFVPRMVELSDDGIALGPQTPVNITAATEYNRAFFEIAERHECLRVDKFGQLCPDGVCKVASEQENAVYYYDKHHLTLAGAAYYARQFRSHCEDKGCAYLNSLAAAD